MLSQTILRAIHLNRLDKLVVTLFCCSYHSILLLVAFQGHLYLLLMPFVLAPYLFLDQVRFMGEHSHLSMDFDKVRLFPNFYPFNHC